MKLFTHELLPDKYIQHGVEIAEINLTYKEAPMSIDFTKPVQTRDGHKVRILCTDRKSDAPVVGLISDKNEGESLVAWSTNGKIYNSYSASDYDLVNVPEKHVRWLVFFKTMIWGHFHTAEEARQYVEERYTQEKPALSIVRVEFEQGQRDN